MRDNSILNSDILFIYDAKMCNPNGDPDDENKPRMDYDTETNLVSDVRLKRYIRDYLEEKGKDIFVARVDGKTVDSTQRLAYWISEKKKAEEIEKILKEGKTPDAKKIVEHISSDDLLEAFIDVRLFGATMPVKGERGESFTFTGPVQFNWGYSLNKVNLVESSTISSTFAGRTRGGQEEEHGTFGKDYRVYYSLIAFHGIISAKRAEYTHLSVDDLKLLREALIKSIPLQATRSKIGQYPRLFLQVEYVDKDMFIGDLRRFVKSKPEDIGEDKIRDISHVELEMDGLVKVLVDQKDKVNKIYFWQDRDLKPEFESLIQDEGLKKKFEPIEV